jgi:toxin ParE1/3/4
VQVVVSLRARADILDIHSYLSQHSPAAADRTIARSELRASLRGLLMDGYIAFYLVEADRIVIVRVLDGRRDFKHEFSK